MRVVTSMNQKQRSPRVYDKQKCAIIANEHIEKVMRMEDPRSFETCGDCMWLYYDDEASCWEFCKGKYKFNARV